MRTSLEYSRLRTSTASRAPPIRWRPVAARTGGRESCASAGRLQRSSGHVASIRHESRIRIGDFAKAEPEVQATRALVCPVDKERQLALAELLQSPTGHLADQPAAEPPAAPVGRNADAPEVTTADAQVALPDGCKPAFVVDERPAIDGVDLRIFAEGLGREGMAEVGAAPGAKLLSAREPGHQLRKLL